MQSEPIKFVRARYISSVATSYLVTLLFVLYIFNPGIIHSQKAEALRSEAITQAMPARIIAGSPIRVVLPDSGIDLQVDRGVYDKESNSWTLSGYNAQFAEVTALANNYSGNTFIYGHNNKYVFGHIKNIQPGQKALIYTDNNHVFSYSYVSTVGVDPSDTSVLDYRGPSILTIQTCSGNWNEVRQLYKFKFQKVE